MHALDLERRRSNVNSDAVASSILYGSPERLVALQRIWARVEHDVEAFGKGQRPHMNHAERYVEACKKIQRFVAMVGEEGEDPSLDALYDAYLPIDESLPIDVHLSMFIPIMALHTSAAQRKAWYTAAKSFRIIGAYAQTEVAHGSNVRGIQTTAAYDKAADEFIITSPTLSSAKWWPGGLAHTATHAVVYANLLVGDKNLGPHPFFVQLRSLIDHTPLDGIETGDVGPKLGYNSMDNGYALFHGVRIPRTHMLMGYAQLSREGLYTKQDGAEKVAYGIMLDVRARICINSAYVLARALTIGVRYSCVREQGFATGLAGSRSGTGAGTNMMEVAVMEYPTQQRVLMPLLSLCFALHYNGAEIRADYVRYTETHELALLPDLHATSAGLKALITYRVSDGIEACRKMCGGHGFLVNAGFADLHTSYLAFATLEGTREVLQQQAGRHLIKVLASLTGSEAATGGKPHEPSPRTRYLRDCIPYLQRTFARPSSSSSSTSTSTSSSIEDSGAAFAPLDVASLLSLANIIGDVGVEVPSAAFDAAAQALLIAHRRCAAWCVAAATAASKAAPGGDALIAASVEICDAAEAHSELQIVEAFARGVQSLPPTGPDESSRAATRHAFRVMFLLHAISVLRARSGYFVAARVLRAADFTQLGRLQGLLCAVLRRDAVNLVESWQFSDARLDSTLGRSDGKYVEALFDAARQEPLNAAAVSDGYKRHLRHVINREPSLPVSEDGRLIDRLRVEEEKRPATIRSKL